MVFSSTLGLGLRHASLRCTHWIGGVQLSHQKPHSRLFSSLLQYPHTSVAPRITLGRCILPSSRNYTKPSGSGQTPVTESTTSPVEITNPVNEALPVEVATSDPLSSLSDSIATHSIIPLQYGDFAQLGLATWSPIGLIAWSYELINVTTGLPWFWTIILGSTLWRLACVPFALEGIRTSARLRPYQGLVQRAREKMTKAQADRDMIELQKANMEIKSIYKKADVNVIKGMILPVFGQLPITVGMFFALRRMCQLPVEQLSQSGFTLLPDLTVADPTYVLPVIFCGLINLQISVGARDLNTQDSPNAGHFMNLFRVISLAMVYVMSSFPSGLFIGLMTTTSLTIAQSVALRSNVVRQFLKIPILNKEHHGRIPSIMESIRFVTETFSSNTKQAPRNQLKKGRKL